MVSPTPSSWTGGGYLGDRGLLQLALKANMDEVVRLVGDLAVVMGELSRQRNQYSCGLDGPQQYVAPRKPLVLNSTSDHIQSSDQPILRHHRLGNLGRFGHGAQDGQKAEPGRRGG